jgi:P27 family predicted phage terminase small subunit
VQLSEGAQKVWDRLAPDLIDRGVLSAWDCDAFSIYCDAAATYYECRAAIGNAYTQKGSVKDTEVKSPLWRIILDCIDVMAKIGGKFGLTPSDRAGIDVSELETKRPTTGPERLLS